MPGQLPLEKLLGPARSAPYKHAAGGDPGRAGELYRWASELAGTFHSQLAYVEVAVRNAIDAQLVLWNAAQPPAYTGEWTAEGNTAPPLYAVLGSSLGKARSDAAKRAGDRHPNHPRHQAPVTHDDTLAQFMFGTWHKLIHPPAKNDDPAKQQQLWREATSKAFPKAAQDETGRLYIAGKLETLRKLRNRVAHHENLLDVRIRHRLNDILALLGKIDEDYPAIIAKSNPLREIARRDPRMTWTQES